MPAAAKGIPDEAVEWAWEAYLQRTHGKDRMRSALEAALPFLQFSPLGDNHHNAAACPYCTPPESGVVFLTDSEKQALAWACQQPERAMHERCMFPHGSHARAFESAREKLS